MKNTAIQSLINIILAAHVMAASGGALLLANPPFTTPDSPVPWRDCDRPRRSDPPPLLNPDEPSHKEIINCLDFTDCIIISTPQIEAKILAFLRGQQPAMPMGGPKLKGEIQKGAVTPDKLNVDITLKDFGIEPNEEDFAFTLNGPMNATRQLAPLIISPTGKAMNLETATKDFKQQWTFSQAIASTIELSGGGTSGKISHVGIAIVTGNNEHYSMEISEPILFEINTSSGTKITSGTLRWLANGKLVSVAFTKNGEIEVNGKPLPGDDFRTPLCCPKD